LDCGLVVSKADFIFYEVGEVHKLLRDLFNNANLLPYPKPGARLFFKSGKS